MRTRRTPSHVFRAAPVADLGDVFPGKAAVAGNLRRTDTGSEGGANGVKERFASAVVPRFGSLHLVAVVAHTPNSTTLLANKVGTALVRRVSSTLFANKVRVLNSPVSLSSIDP